jgi:hypothetical protein
MEMTMDITGMIRPTVDRSAVARALDGVGIPARVKAVAELVKRDLAALFDAAADNPPPSLEDFVPREVPAKTEVIHEGKNSLAMFTRFQKRFFRPTEGATELWGYNHQAMSLFTGPGYFVTHRPPGSELIIDYTRLPGGKLDAWPPILPNSARLSRVVYYGTQDVMRTVSQGVTIGRARRGSRIMDAWFILVRQI